jgi:hypothetical protein
MESTMPAVIQIMLTLSVMLSWQASLHGQGDLNPPSGAPAENMKSLREIYDKLDAQEQRIQSLEQQNQTLQALMASTLSATGNGALPWHIYVVDDKHTDFTDVAIALDSQGLPAVIYKCRKSIQHAILLRRYTRFGLINGWTEYAISQVGTPMQATVAAATNLDNGHPAFAYHRIVGDPSDPDINEITYLQFNTPTQYIQQTVRDTEQDPAFGLLDLEFKPGDEAPGIMFGVFEFIHGEGLHYVGRSVSTGQWSASSQRIYANYPLDADLLMLADDTPAAIHSFTVTDKVQYYYRLGVSDPWELEQLLITEFQSSPTAPVAAGLLANGSPVLANVRQLGSLYFTHLFTDVPTRNETVSDEYADVQTLLLEVNPLNQLVCAMASEGEAFVQTFATTGEKIGSRYDLPQGSDGVLAMDLTLTQEGYPMVAYIPASGDVVLLAVRAPAPPF